jgi:pyruvate formate lyase activating enzyme
LDPIEKKPFFNYKPGTKVLSFGTPGCNLRCTNCQNSFLSQFIRDSEHPKLSNKLVFPKEIVKAALQSNADGIAYTYSEPTLFFEYFRDIIRACRASEDTGRLFHVMVSNGFFSREALKIIIDEKLIDAINIDLKFMTQKKYASVCGASLEPILENIRSIAAHKDQIFMEITNLIIPGENDRDEDFRQISEFIASVSKDIPLHFSRFFPTYKMTDKEPSKAESLIRAMEIAKDAGLKYVYTGNISFSGKEKSENPENTYCPNCGKLLIKREAYHLSFNAFAGFNDIKGAFCPECKKEVEIVL